MNNIPGNETVKTICIIGIVIAFILILPWPTKCIEEGCNRNAEYGSSRCYSHNSEMNKKKNANSNTNNSTPGKGTSNSIILNDTPTKITAPATTTTKKTTTKTTTKSKKPSTKKTNSSKNSYDEGYEDVYENDDYDWDRYYSDDDYADGVDDAMDELDW